MQRYKNYHLYTRAMRSNGTWRVKGVILNPGIKVMRQVMHFDTVHGWVSRGEAEQFVLKLCKLWIDVDKRGCH